MKKILRKIISSFGYELTKIELDKLVTSPYNEIIKKRKIVDIDALAQISAAIPGMITPRSGQFLYALCYMQELRGDVVEIGSWQGRSASFLARAVKNSGNGKFYAIDHFKGNVGKENLYIVEKQDLSDLKASFCKNMENIGLLDSVVLLDMSSNQAAEELKDNNIRFLFVDGDHTKEGVRKDIDLFFPKLTAGSIIVFDDFQEGFPGLVSAVDEFLEEMSFSKMMTYKNTLVLEL